MRVATGHFSDHLSGAQVDSFQWKIDALASLEIFNLHIFGLLSERVLKLKFRRA